MWSRQRILGTAAIALTAPAILLSGCGGGGGISSPLNASQPLRCESGAHSCTAPGSIRWSLPLSGIDLNTPRVAPERQLAAANDPDATNSDVAQAVSDGPLTIFHHDGVVEAIESSSGVIRWHTVLPDVGQSLANPFLDVQPVLGASTVTVEECTSPPDRTRIWTLNLANGEVVGRGLVIANNCKERSGLVADSAAGPDIAEQRANGDWLVGLNANTGTVRWQVLVSPNPVLFPPAESAVVGNVLYVAARAGSRAVIARFDVATGQRLPSVALDPRLPASGIVSGQGAGLGVLLYTGVNTIARIDPDTGRVLWILHPTLNEDASANVVRVDVANETAYFDVDLPNHTFQRQVVSLATGQLEFSFAADRVLDWEAGGNPNPQQYDGRLITDSGLTGIPAHEKHVGLVRVEALDPHTLQPVWVGPWTSDSFQILTGGASPPHLAIVVSCAPNGIERGATICTKPRLYAINT